MTFNENFIYQLNIDLDELRHTNRGKLHQFKAVFVVKMQKIVSGQILRAELGWVSHPLYRQGFYFNTGLFKQQLESGVVQFDRAQPQTDPKKRLETILEYEIRYISNQGQECKDLFDEQNLKVHETLIKAQADAVVISVHHIENAR